MSTIDWSKIAEWDEKYNVHAFVTSEEYSPVLIERTEGNYLVTPGGTRLLDFYNQLYCVNAGQNVPEIQRGIKEALDRYGFLWDIYTTDYKAEVSKILVEDVLKDSGWAAKVRYALGGGDAVETAVLFAASTPVNPSSPPASTLTMVWAARRYSSRAWCRAAPTPRTPAKRPGPSRAACSRILSCVLRPFAIAARWGTGTRSAKRRWLTVCCPVWP